MERKQLSSRDRGTLLFSELLLGLKIRSRDFLVPVPRVLILLVAGYVRDEQPLKGLCQVVPLGVSGVLARTGLRTPQAR